MLDSILDSLRVIALPTKTNFRSITSREVALFQGTQGWGEFSPFLEYGHEESAPWLVSAFEAAYVETPKPIRDSVEVNATLPAINTEVEISNLLAGFSGVKVVKIKVGLNTDEDLARIEYVRRLLPNAKIRIDVNGLWGVDQAEAFLNQVGEIEYVEQPCSNILELRELKKRTAVKIAGDEIIRKAKDPFQVELSGAVDILMLKVAPLGGIARSIQIAKHHGLPVVVSSALESAVGISHGLKLAAAVEHLDYACGLGTGALLAVDVAEFLIIGGLIQVREITPDAEVLTKFAVTDERLNWWRNRIRMTWNAGAKDMITEAGWS